MSKLYFFRHAQASYGAVNYDQLSDLGQKQSAILGEYLTEKNIQFDKIFTGPLVRQKHTCEIVSRIYTQKKLDIPKPVILQNLKEHSCSEALKTAFPDLIHSNPKIKKWHEEIQSNPDLKRKNSLQIFEHFMEQWVEDNIKVPTVESWQAFRKDTKDALAKILEQTKKGETIGIFTSGGTLSSITAEILGMEDQKRIARTSSSVRNTSFSTFLYSRDKINLLTFNELPHLEKNMVTFV